MTGQLLVLETRRESYSFGKPPKIKRLTSIGNRLTDYFCCVYPILKNMLPVPQVLRDKLNEGAPIMIGFYQHCNYLDDI
jgi:hypothetical protein